VTSAPAAVVQNTMSLDQAAGIGARDLIWSANPQRRKSSMVRADVVFARGLTAETIVRGSITAQ